MNIINLITDSTLETGLANIRTSIIAWINRVKAYLPNVTNMQSIEPQLGGTLADINTELVDKGSTQADDYSEVAEKISDIETGITPTGQIAITQNGTYDVTDYAQILQLYPLLTDNILDRHPELIPDTLEICQDFP